MDNSKYYVFYDGDCGFCNHWVHWILKNDHKDLFRFASLQSDFGQNFLRDRGLDQKQLNTIYLWKPESFYLIKSDAILTIAKLLGGKYYVMAKLNIFPKFFSDGIYNQVAKRRQKLGPKNCELPTPEERKKFVS